MTVPTPQDREIMQFIQHISKIIEPLLPQIREHFRPKILRANNIIFVQNSRLTLIHLGEDKGKIKIELCGPDIFFHPLIGMDKPNGNYKEFGHLIFEGKDIYYEQ